MPTASRDRLRPSKETVRQRRGERQRWRALAALLGGLAFAAAAPAAAAGPASVALRASIEAFADSRIEEGRPVAARVPLSRVALPLAGRLRRALAAVGVVLVDEGTQARLIIVGRALALGQTYDYMARLRRFRALRFNGARVVGGMSLAMADGRTCRVRFAGEVRPPGRIPVRFGEDTREDARLAPFAEAMGAPGGFEPALAALIGAVWGGREAAAMALGLAPGTPAPAVVCGREEPRRGAPGGRGTLGLTSEATD